MWSVVQNILVFILIFISKSIFCSEVTYKNERSDLYVVSDVILDLMGDILPSYEEITDKLVRFIQYNLFNNDHDNDDLNITEIIATSGYEAETHEVITDDDYILRIFRIVGTGEPILLMHGLLMSSDDWVTAGKGRALALLLAAEGYDVWLGNARGNFHSRNHLRLSPESKNFWDFSWDEIGRYDLPALIDYILETTNRTNLQYIGHSQGTTCFFVMCSYRPEYNEKVNKMISLSTVAWMSHVKSPLLRLISPLAPLSFLLDLYEFLPRHNNRNVVSTTACRSPLTATYVCNNLLSLIGGFDPSQVNSTYLPVVFQHLPAGSSFKQLLHYAQLIVSGHFRKYDYGWLENFVKYDAANPPDYKIENVKVPVYIFHGENDWLSNITDVEILIHKLPNFKDLYTVPLKTFNHIDYLYANDVKTLLYDKIISTLKL